MQSAASDLSLLEAAAREAGALARNLLAKPLEIQSKGAAGPVTNIDFAAVLPFIDDATSLAALRGAGALSIDVNFDSAAGKLVDGRFKIDLTGLDLRIADAYFPVASSIMDITWNPEAGQFTLDEAALQRVAELPLDHQPAVIEQRDDDHRARMDDVLAGGFTAAGQPHHVAPHIEETTAPHLLGAHLRLAQVIVVFVLRMFLRHAPASLADSSKRHASDGLTQLASDFWIA